MDISIISNVVAMMFFVLLVGFAARKLGWVDEITSKQISRLIIRVCQPMLIISSQIKIEFSPDKLLNGFIVFLIGMFSHALLSLMSYLACRFFKNFDRRKICEFAMIFANVGFLGYPVLGALIGDEGVFYASFYVLAFNTFAWTWGMVILGRGRDDIKMNFKNIVINFGTVPSFIGIILYVLSPYFTLPAFVTDGMTSLGNICTPMSIFLCGMLLANVKFKEFFNRPQVYYASVMRLIVLPIVVTLIVKLISIPLGIPEMMVSIAAIMTALPTAAITAMFAELHDIEPEFAAQIVGTSTALCVATVPLIVFLANIIIAL